MAGATDTDRVTAGRTDDGTTVEGCEDTTAGGNGGYTRAGHLGRGHDAEQSSELLSLLKLRERVGRLFCLPPITVFCHV